MNRFQEIYVRYILLSTQKRAKQYIVLSVLMPPVLAILLDGSSAVTAFVFIFILLSYASVKTVYQRFIADNISVTLILSDGVSKMIKDLMMLSLRRTVCCIALASFTLMISYLLMNGLYSISLYESLFILTALALILNFNSVQWTMLIKTRRSVSQAVEILFMAAMLISSTILVMYDPVKFVIGFCTTSVVVIFGTYLLVKYSKISKEKILAGV